FVPNVLVSMAPAQNMSSKPMLTNGDNAGVAHPMFMQPGGTIMGNPTVLMGGMPASHLGAPSYGNNFNNPVGAKTVPSITNVLIASSTLLMADGMREMHTVLGHDQVDFHVRRDGIAIVRLRCLSLTADRWLRLRLDRARPRAVVLDLRGNPGGSVETATRIAAFLAHHATPLAVAVDAHTASAAEVLTAQLLDAGLVPVFGERTFGKGIARWFRWSPDELTPHAGAASLLRRDAAPIQDAGVAPSHPCAGDHAVREAVQWLRQGTPSR
ncbi:MAG: DUF4150 domain-containing protein, partial [Planctomycetes bacterium]|nr:DUF4150 domain-containing protein [Planctomycetota bacterium]